MIRRLCALGAMLVLVAQGSTGGHMLLVEHTRCAEHGELVHGGQAHVHELDDRASSEDPAIAGDSDPARDDAHEHCAVSADRRDAATTLVDAPRSIVSLISDDSAAPESLRIVLETKRHRLAPKNSPPA